MVKKYFVCDNRCRTCTRTVRHGEINSRRNGVRWVRGGGGIRALSPLFAVVMDRWTDEVYKLESAWTLMFADNIAICSESMEQVE